MNKTAVIMSHEEAMALPQAERPLSYRITSKMYHAVFEMAGAASMCWRPKPGSAVFDSEQAAKFATDCCFAIAEELERLGITTEQMRAHDSVPTPNRQSS